MLRQLAQAARDARDLGVAFASLPLRRALGSKRQTVMLKGIGPVTLRLDDSDVDVFRQVFVERQYDLTPFPAQRERVRRRYSEITEAGRTPVIIDAGANVGASALYFARQFPAATIIAIEPDPASAELCRDNTRAAGTIEVLEAALGGRPGSVTLERPEPASWAVRTRRSASGGVATVTVPDVARHAGPTADLFIVKVDIEGFEADVFDSPDVWIRQPIALYVEIHDWMFPLQHTSTAVLRATLELGHDVLISRENLLFIG